MIKQVKVEELKDSEFKKLALEFLNESKVPGKFKFEAFIENWTNLINSNVGIMWVSVVDNQIAGALGALLFPDINSGELVVMEAFWFMGSEARGSKEALKLLNQLEYFAKEVEATRITLVHLKNLSPEKLKQFYEKKGYVEIETHYIKEL